LDCELSILEPDGELHHLDAVVLEGIVRDNFVLDDVRNGASGSAHIFWHLPTEIVQSDAELVFNHIVGDDVLGV
jgi:hypothetical protein